MSNDETTTINQYRLKKMKYQILKAEQENLKTRERPEEDMVDLIRRIIIDETKKTY